MSAKPSPAASALVTGAGAGIGLAVAKRLAARGFKVTCVDVDPAAAQRAAQACGGGERYARRQEAVVWVWMWLAHALSCMCGARWARRESSAAYEGVWLRRLKTAWCSPPLQGFTRVALGIGHGGDSVRSIEAWKPPTLLSLY